MKVVKFKEKEQMKFKSIYKRKYFKFIKKAKKDFYFLVGDIEAHIDDRGQFVFELGIFFDGDSFYIFETLESYYEGINNYFANLDIKKSKKNIYFHNLDFDIIFFMKELNFNENIKIINSGNMMLNFSDENFSFRNSLSILPMSLKQVVKVWLKIDFKEWEEQKDNVLELEKDVLETYCMRDCFLLFFAVFKLKDVIRNKYSIDDFLTIPSLSIKIWRNFFNNSSVLDYKKSSFFNEGFYYGGHTEKFVNGLYDFKDYGLEYYDVNSLYPFIMRDLLVNTSKFVMLKPTLENVFLKLYKKEIFYIDCKIEIKHDNFRVIPIKYNGSNYYPKGVFDCKISNITIEFLVKNNHFFLKELYGIVSHEKDEKSKIFFDFVTEFYELRKSDAENDTIYKFLLNSLYGKFGQNEEQTKTILNPNSVDGFTSVVQFNNNLLCSKDEKPFYNVPYLRKDIAGIITEKSRIYMAQNRLKAYKRGVKVFYQDTDSLIVGRRFETDYVLKEIVSNTELGLFKRENVETVHNAFIIGLKIYFLTDKLSARKGLKNIKQGNYKSIAYALYLNNVYKVKVIKFFECNEKKKIDLTLFPNLLFYNDRFTKPKTFIKKGFFGIQRVPHYITKISEKLDILPLDYYIN